MSGVKGQESDMFEPSPQLEVFVLSVDSRGTHRRACTLKNKKTANTQSKGLICLVERDSFIYILLSQENPCSTSSEESEIVGAHVGRMGGRQNDQLSTLK